MSLHHHTYNTNIENINFFVFFYQNLTFSPSYISYGQPISPVLSHFLFLLQHLMCSSPLRWCLRGVLLSHVHREVPVEPNSWNLKLVHDGGSLYTKSCLKSVQCLGQHKHHVESPLKSRLLLWQLLEMQLLHKQGLWQKKCVKTLEIWNQTEKSCIFYPPRFTSSTSVSATVYTMSIKEHDPDTGWACVSYF